MDLVSNVEQLNAKVKNLELAFLQMSKRVALIEGTPADKTMQLTSGAYAASIHPTWHQEHGAYSLKIFFSGMRIIIDTAVDAGAYLEMFRRDRKNLELFLAIANLDPTDVSRIHEIKFMVKVAKGGSEFHMPEVKSIKAIGFWSPGEFIDLHVTEGEE